MLGKFFIALVVFVGLYVLLGLLLGCIFSIVGAVLNPTTILVVVLAIMAYMWLTKNGRKRRMR